MGDKSDKKPPEITDSHAKSKASCETDRKPTLTDRTIASTSDYAKKFFSKLYPGNSSATTNNIPSESSSNNITALISAAEKRIKEFYETVAKKVTHFLENDFQKFRDLGKDELTATKIKHALLDYKTQLEKISQEKMTRIAEIKSQLQTRFMTAEEVQSFVKYIDERMAEIKKKTENVLVMMKENEVANNFVKDLQSIVTDYNKKITSAVDSLYNALKETAGDLSRSVPDRKTIMTKMPKMPTTSEMQKMPSMMSKVFRKMGTSGTPISGKAGGTPLIPIALREKLPYLNLSKHFNSETMHGRANVAKATYATAFLTFLYWKFRHSRS